MKVKTFIYAASIAMIFLVACKKLQSDNKPEEGITSVRYDFENENGWFFFNQDTATVKNYEFRDGHLNLRTRAFSNDRSKFHTDSIHFTTGTYTWRVRVPDIDSATNTFVAVWLYNDDDHELDFQIGYGKKKSRSRLRTPEDKLIAQMTCMGYPFLATGENISPGWHTLSINLGLNYLNHYVATWLIDGRVAQKVNLDYGPEYSFFICCSLENNHNFGDGISSEDYVAQFDYVEFKGKIMDSKYPPYVPGEKYRYGDSPAQSDIASL